GIGGAHPATLPDAEEPTLRRLEPPLVCACSRIDGKRVAEASIAGRLAAVSAATAEIWLEDTVELREPLRLLVHAAGGTPRPEAYAKVTGVERNGAGATVRLAFTSLPTEVKVLLITDP